RYLAPWLTRWISPDSAGAVDGLNLYVYVDNNPLKYIDPTGHGVDTILFDNFLDRINRDKTSELNIWIGDAHGLPDGKKLLATLAKSIDPNHIGNLVIEDITVSILEDKRLTRYPETSYPTINHAMRIRDIMNIMRIHNIDRFNATEIYTYERQARALIDNNASANGKFKGRFIGGEKWKNPRLEISRITGNVLALVGATHLLTSIVPTRHLQYMHTDSCPVQEHLKPNTSIALIPKNVIDLYIAYKISRQGNFVDEFGVWVNGKDNNPEDAFLVVGRGEAMRERFGDVMQPIPIDLSKLSPIKEPNP
ncbi:hypothetical protein BSPLISOX_1203, partial [uncultured Gammaproteobacteria bacterium]